MTYVHGKIYKGFLCKKIFQSSFDCTGAFNGKKRLFKEDFKLVIYLQMSPPLEKSISRRAFKALRLKSLTVLKELLKEYKDFEV